MYILDMEAASMIMCILTTTSWEDWWMQQDNGQDMGPADEEWTVLDQQKQSAVDVWEEDNFDGNDSH